MQHPFHRLLAAGALATLAAGAHAFDLTVEVLNARSEQGMVLGALYDSAEHWMHEPVQGERAAAGAKAVLVYRNLQPGRYALSVFHDENGNGKLDTNIAGIPVEHYGFSRDAAGRMGPPSFADAALDLNADTTITIHLR
jgi:uncharacterized protein (DUF2141 family)